MTGRKYRSVQSVVWGELDWTSAVTAGWRASVCPNTATVTTRYTQLWLRRDVDIYVYVLSRVSTHLMTCP